MKKNIEIPETLKQFLQTLFDWFEEILKNEFFDPDSSILKISEKGDIYEPKAGENTVTGSLVVLSHTNLLAFGKYENGVLQAGSALILYQNGDYYQGAVCRGGACDGQGELFYADGGSYSGQFQHLNHMSTQHFLPSRPYSQFVKGIRVGKGRMTYPDGSQYIGQFINDEAEGHGIFTDSCKNRYMSVVSTSPTSETGHFIKGRLYGQGELRYNNSNIYKGNFKGMKRDGEGTMYYNAPSPQEPKTGVYKGMWRRDKREGHGEMQYDNMSVFKGTWKQNYPFYGEFSEPDGTKYVGHFSDSKFHGFGTLYLNTGIIAEGEFVYGEFSKSGTLIFDDGSKFTGHVEDFEIGDRGILIFPNKNKYEGQFSNSRPNGFGILNSHNGDKYEGKWEEGQKCGFGKEYIVKNKEYYEGYFERDLRNGEGKLITSKGEMYETVYLRGEMTSRSVMPIQLPTKIYEKKLSSYLKNRPIMEPKVHLII